MTLRCFGEIVVINDDLNIWGLKFDYSRVWACFLHQVKSHRMVHLSKLSLFLNIIGKIFLVVWKHVINWNLSIANGEAFWKMLIGIGILFFEMPFLFINFPATSMNIMKNILKKVMQTLHKAKPLNRHIYPTCVICNLHFGIFHS